MHWRSNSSCCQPAIRSLTIAISTFLTCSTGFSQSFNEVEPNESKTAATPIVLTTTGDGLLGQISGSTTGSSTSPGANSIDYYKLTLPTDAAGIYRYELLLTSTGGASYTSTIRGLTQSAGMIGTGNTAFQTNNSPFPNFSVGNVVYGFGSPSQFYYAVSGTSTTTSAYTTQISRQSISPIVITEQFHAGDIMISTINQTAQDTSFVVLDSSFNPVPGFSNNDATIAGGSPIAGLQSYAKRTLTAGTYYVAISNTVLATNRSAATDDGNRSTPVLDFPGVLATSWAALPSSYTVAVGDSCRIVNVPNVPTQFAGITFLQFTVAASVDVPCVALTATPNPVPSAQMLTVQATVTPATTGNSTITSVVADLSALGGSSATPMFNDGLTASDTAVDATWTAQVSVNYIPGLRFWSAVATDASGRSASNTAIVSVSPVVPPNDLCSQAISLNTLPVQYGIGLGLATNDGVALPCNTTNGSSFNGIWFTYTPAASCLFTAIESSTRTLSAPSYIALYDGTNGCSNLGSPLVCGIKGSALNLPMAAGRSYLIYVSLESQSTSTNDTALLDFSSSALLSPPINDTCAGAIDFQSFPFFDLQSLGGATSDPINTCMQGTAGGASETEVRSGIWYRHTNGSSPCQLVFGPTSRNNATTYSIYEGSCSGPEVFCNTTTSNIETFVMKPATTYYFLLASNALPTSSTYSYPGPSDTLGVTFTDCVTTPAIPDNSSCELAKVISSVPFTGNELVVGAPRNLFNLVCTNKKKQFNCIWYEYTPAYNQTATFTETYQPTNGAISVFTGSCNNLTNIACFTTDTSASNTLALTAGVSYRILVFYDGSAAGGGTSLTDSLKLSVTAISASGACCNGATCTVLAHSACTGSYQGNNTVCETAQSPTTCCVADANHSGTVTVNDIFFFLSAWFAGNISADANSSGTVTVQDIFFFLSRWFAGC